MNNELKVSGIVLSGIISALVLIPLFGADTTIFLTTENGGTPVSCAPANGLVLAQNITDLCDVTIINATSGQIIEYNGTQWVNVNSTVFTDTTVCSNFNNPNPNKGLVCIEGTNVQLRALVGSTGITISNSSDTVTISSTISGESTVCNNAGSSSSLSEGICIDNAVTLKRLLEGTGITLSSNSTHITLTNSLPESTACNNVGTGNQLCSGGNVNVDTLIAGTGISITDTTDDWTIANTGVTSVTSDSNSTIGVVPTTGNVVLYPRYELLCENSWSSGQSFSCSGFEAKTNLHVKIIASHNNAGTGMQTAIQFNSDTGNNYADRLEANGAADNTGNTRANCRLQTALDVEGGGTFTMDITNISTLNKLSHNQGDGFLTRLVSAPPSKLISSCEWVNTSSQITTITVTTNAGNDNYNSNARIYVWGYD